MMCVKRIRNKSSGNGEMGKNLPSWMVAEVPRFIWTHIIVKLHGCRKICDITQMHLRFVKGKKGLKIAI